MLLKVIGYCIIIGLYIPVVSSAQNIPDFYISNQGKDTYPGTSPILPRKTITATIPLLNSMAKLKGTAKLALKSDNIFNETLIADYPIEIKSYTDNTDGDPNFAIMDGGKEFSTGWIKDSTSNHIYKQDITHFGFTGEGIVGIENYSYIYVTEIDKELEKTAPFTARKILAFYNSLQLADQNPGSFYLPYSRINPLDSTQTIYIHTSNDLSPNANDKYRYEVTIRDWAVNSSGQSGSKFENLWIRGYGAGNGMLPGGNNPSYNKIIFGPGAGVHHLVVPSGTINHSLFLPSAKNTSEFAVVFYDTAGSHRHCTIRNSIFMDIPAPMYMHTSGSGSNYSALEIDNTVAFADTLNRRPFTYTSNNDSVTLNNVYAEGFTNGYNYGSAKYASINNCYFKDVTYFGISYGTTNPVYSIVNNCFIKTKTAAYATGILMQAGTTLNLINSIIHIKTDSSKASFIDGCDISGTKLTALRNIFIGDVPSSQTIQVATIVTGDGIYKTPHTWDNNVYILLKGNKIEWRVIVTSANGWLEQDFDNFEQWKKQTRQDAHSLFFDLRNDPRGLKAIFADPANGNYELANTPEGNQIAALGAGMTSPITCFIKKPTYEEAADLIRNNSMLSINECRNPCTQNTIRVNNTLAVAATDDQRVNITWNVAEQQNISEYELQKAAVNSTFTKVALVPVGVDSSYSYTDNNIWSGVPYQYRLVVIAKAGNSCYSKVIAIKIVNKNHLIVYPNPSDGKFLISVNGYIGKVHYSVLNSNGQSVTKGDFFSLYVPQPLDLTAAAKGVYFIKAETADFTSIQKLVKE